LVDALSDVLGAVHLTGAVFLEMEMRQDWSYLTAPARAIADVLMPEADHVIPYHLVLAGSCYASLLDGEPVKLTAGDVVLFPAGDRHLLVTASIEGLRLKPVEISGESLRGMLKRSAISTLREGNAGNATRIVCGFLACDGRMAEPILKSLPRLLRINLRDSGTAAWVQSSIQFSVAQSAAQRPGSAMVLARLSEVLFAEAVRQYMDSLPEDRSGWLGALRDRHVGRALSLLHEGPGQPWTLEVLSREVGLSRSALGERFAALVGKSPMQYLTSWRIATAASKLRRGEGSILRIATDVGYESEAAFSRAFKRECGLPPAAWRRKQAGTD
jgi:AraC family transcriptional regulator, alkane utilization regulator